MPLPSGFRVGGVTAGIKPSGNPDLALFVSDTPCPAHGVFTRNRVFGAPVGWSRSRLPRQTARAVLINSGNANACTGPEGEEHCARMAAAAAAAIGCEADDVLVCSTGIIGQPLPIDRITAAVPSLVDSLGTTDSHIDAAARAMMTTDTQPKVHHTAHGVGFAKGAAMIAPNMGTMLAVLLAEADPASLPAAVDETFNRISIDGHTSTSDSVIALSRPGDGSLAELCRPLAEMIVLDGEGAGHFVEVLVSGLEPPAADRVARTVAGDALVKTAITGNDPNWGRIVSCAGWSGVDFDPGRLQLRINGVTVFDGQPTETDEAALSESMRTTRPASEYADRFGPRGGVTLELRFDGIAKDPLRFLTTDLSQEYVRLNSEYTT